VPQNTTITEMTFILQVSNLTHTISCHCFLDHEL